MSNREPIIADKHNAFVALVVVAFLALVASLRPLFHQFFDGWARPAHLLIVLPAALGLILLGKWLARRH